MGLRQGLTPRRVVARAGQLRSAVRKWFTGALAALLPIALAAGQTLAEPPAPAGTAHAPADTVQPTAGEHANKLTAEELADKLTAAELADGWILLFDGETTFGWRATSRADWVTRDGIISVRKGDPGWLQTTSEFSDFVLRTDFRKQPDTNSGIFLRSAREPKDPKLDCYEVNIAGTAVSPFATGSLVERKKATSAPDDGEWHTLEITARGDEIAVSLDGKGLVHYRDPRPIKRGTIGLQYKSGAVEFKSVKLKPLGLTPIFNGKSLDGWNPYPGKPAVFSITPDGALNIRGGNGQLETIGRYRDFILQTEIFVGGKHLNSGIFFRSIPGQLWQGYESQIDNAFRDNDRTRPVDCGTGGFYRRQDARKVVADDLTWFSKTLVVSGNHMAAWVNGYQVSDWTDTRKPNENPRRGQRLAAGTIILQVHDATTNLSFRKMRIAELPTRE